MDDWEGSITSGGGVSPSMSEAKPLKKKFSMGAQLSVLGVAVLVLGTVVAVFGSQQSTENRSRASVSEIIIDNPSAGIVGSWATGTSAAGHYGSDYRFAGPGTGSSYLQYIPAITTSGQYDVYEWHSQGTNRTTTAKYVITYSGGSQTVSVNQQANGGKWNLLGRYSFSQGSTGNVKITNSFSGTSSIVVIADAIKFVHVGGSSAPTPTRVLSPTSVPVSSTGNSTSGNKVSNSGFESQDTNWSSWNNAGAAMSNAHSGSYSMRIGTGAGGRYQNISFSGSSAGYVLSGWGKVSTSGEKGYIGVHYLNSSGTQIGKQSMTYTSTTYVSQQIGLTIPSGTTKIQVWTWKDAGSGYFYADDISMGQSTQQTQPTPTSVSLPTLTSTPIPTVAPTFTPIPTSFSTITPSITVPTVTLVPTTIANPSAATIALTLSLHGIGENGNVNPIHPQRTVFVDIYDSQNQLVQTKEGLVTYQASSGKFVGDVDLGTDILNGAYTVKVKADQYLRSVVPGIPTLALGQVTVLPDVELIAGDINGDNVINIIDYGILMGCYSDLLPPDDCSDENALLSDLTDDGKTNQFDYNFFLRELSSKAGQ